MWSSSSPSLAKTICKPMIKQQNHKNHSSLFLWDTALENSQCTLTFVWTRNQWRFRVNLLLQHCLLYPDFYRKSEQKETLFQSVINQLGPFTRISWINREIFQTFLRQVSVQLYYFKCIHRLLPHLILFKEILKTKSSMPFLYQKNLRADWGMHWVMYTERGKHWQTLAEYIVHPYSSFPALWPLGFTFRRNMWQ